MSKILVAVALVSGLSGCVNSEQASSEPPGDAVSFPPGGLPECTAEDIKVTGPANQHPTIAVPTSCSAPTKLIVEDLEPGTGPEANKGARMQAHYSLTKWSSGEEVDTSYGQQPFNVANVGSDPEIIEAWNQGLLGMKQGGRRLIVAPPDVAYAGKGGDLENETLVFVIDAVKVTPA